MYLLFSCGITHIVFAKFKSFFTCLSGTAKNKHNGTHKTSQLVLAFKIKRCKGSSVSVFCFFTDSRHLLATASRFAVVDKIKNLSFQTNS